MAGILVVDDYLPNLVALEAALEPLGEPIVRAMSGAQALGYLEKHQCDLVLLDVKMPGLDGFETAALIRERFAEQVPIMFVTASHTAEAEAVRGYSEGAVDYIVKPLDSDLLRAKVAAQIERYRRSELRRENLVREQAESERRRMYASLMQAPAAIAITRGHQHVFDLVNHRYRELLGETEVVGSPAKKVLEGVVPEDILAAFDEVFRTGAPFVGEERPFRPGSSPNAQEEGRFFNTSVQPMKNALGAIDGLMIHSVEVTAQVRARQKEHEAVKLREEFLSVASHELRTPLTALRLQLQMLLRSALGLPAEVARALDTALRQSGRLDRLVGDLLDVSRIKTGTMALEREPLDLVEVVRDVIERHAAETTAAGCELSLDATSVVGRWDRLRLEQAFTNLLTNAIKYAGGRPIAVSVGSDRDTARVIVRDQGIGISALDHERIFGPFERAAPTTSYGGLGLGLYVARKIVRAHGGDIHLESTVGSGSAFTIVLPMNGRDRVG